MRFGLLLVVATVVAACGTADLDTTTDGSTSSLPGFKDAEVVALIEEYHARMRTDVDRALALFESGSRARACSFMVEGWNSLDVTEINEIWAAARGTPREEAFNALDEADDYIHYAAFSCADDDAEVSNGLCKGAHRHFVRYPDDDDRTRQDAG